jgi:hypothetical protein
MSAPQELRKKARRCHALAEDLARDEDASALLDLAAQLEQQADEAEAERQTPPSRPLH